MHSTTTELIHVNKLMSFLRFSDDQTRVLWLYYRNGMNGTGSIQSDLIQKVAAETGLSKNQIVVSRHLNISCGGGVMLLPITCFTTRVG